MRVSFPRFFGGGGRRRYIKRIPDPQIAIDIVVADVSNQCFHRVFFVLENLHRSASMLLMSVVQATKYLNSLVRAKLLCVDWESSPRARFAMPCIPTSCTRAELSCFKHDHTLGRPCLFVKLGQKAAGDLEIHTLVRCLLPRRPRDVQCTHATADDHSICILGYRFLGSVIQQIVRLHLL